VAARLLLVTLRLDLAAARRRAAAAGPWRLLGTLGAAGALVAAEVWLALRLAHRAAAFDPALRPLALAALHRLEGLVVRAAGAVAAASSLSLALPAIRALEADPFRGALPDPPAVRALAAWWRVLAACGWVAALAGPPLATWRLVLGGPGELARLAVAGPLALAAAAAAGVAAAVALAAALPPRFAVPLAWTASTAAVVGAVLWLRALHPERLAAAADPAALLEALAALGAAAAPAAAPLRDPAGAALALAGALAFLLALWSVAGRRAGERLAVAPARRGAAAGWRVLDTALLLRPAGALVAARLRLLARDAIQASQLLYLLGLGAVYLENLRSLPLAEPLARELAGVVNLGMAALLAAALALRFAYPARLLDGEAWWVWATAPLGARARDLALAAAAAVAPLAVAGGLWAGATAILGPTAAGRVGWWLVPALAVELAILGVAAGPDPGEAGGTWLDAALGGGGLAFLALAVGLAGWFVAAAAVPVVRAAIPAWRPPLPLAAPWIPLAAGAALAAGVAARRRR